MTSNLDASRRFYGGLSGWNAEESEAYFGG